MPISKKRRKKRKPTNQRGEDRLSSLTLQDLINVVAYQEQKKNEKKPCKGENTNICVAEGCYDESCLDRVQIEEENEDGR